jgi:hypothetical protein
MTIPYYTCWIFGYMCENIDEFMRSQIKIRGEEVNMDSVKSVKLVSQHLPYA